MDLHTASVFRWFTLNSTGSQHMILNTSAVYIHTVGICTRPHTFSCIHNIHTVQDLTPDIKATERRLEVLDACGHYLGLGKAYMYVSFLAMYTLKYPSSLFCPQCCGDRGNIVDIRKQCRTHNPHTFIYNINLKHLLISTTRQADNDITRRHTCT